MTFAHVLGFRKVHNHSTKYTTYQRYQSEVRLQSVLARIGVVLTEKEQLANRRELVEKTPIRLGPKRPN